VTQVPYEPNVDIRDTLNYKDVCILDLVFYIQGMYLSVSRFKWSFSWVLMVPY